MSKWINLLHKLMAEEGGDAGDLPGGAPDDAAQDSGESDDGGSNEDDAGTDGDAADGEGGGDDGDADNAPENYADFDMPEGVTLDEGMLEVFAPAMKDLGLTQEQAQGLVNIQAQQVQAQQQGQVDAFSQQLEGWITDAKSDKEYGGDKFDESSATALQAVEAFGTPELKTMMETYGVGNHPEMIRFMYRVGQAIKEDSPGGGKRIEGSKDRTSILYPE